MSTSQTAQSFREMWELTCDAFLLEQPFTYKHDLKPLADVEMSHYAPKTRWLMWDQVRRYAVATGQMRRIRHGLYAWRRDPIAELLP
jgi:hypothetical protein